MTVIAVVNTTESAITFPLPGTLYCISNRKCCIKNKSALHKSKQPIWIHRGLTIW